MNERHNAILEDRSKLTLTVQNAGRNDIDHIHDRDQADHDHHRCEADIDRGNSGLHFYVYSVRIFGIILRIEQVIRAVSLEPLQCRLIDCFVFQKSRDIRISL